MGGLNMGNIEKAVQFMVDIANDNRHGYDQTHRNSPDYDCSSLVGTALNKAGFNVSPTSWTGNLRKQLLACGFKEVPVTGARKRGDIFLTESRHVVMCVDSKTIVHASINEKGTTKGGKSGDQTGKEICTRSFYTPSYGWEYHFTLDDTSEPPKKEAYNKEVKATKSASKYDRYVADTYKVTASALNVRDGAGTKYKTLVTIPKGTVVTCYGYYTTVSTVKWLYVQFVYNGIKYTGFCSNRYLRK